MKNFLLLSFLFCFYIAYSQVHMRMRVGIRDTVVVDKYEPLENEFKFQYLKMSPGSHHFSNEKAAELLRKETIVAVDLVYSDYPVGEDFKELNNRRLIELYSALPDAFNRDIVSWRIVKQTGVAKTGGIQNYFHGFVVYYREMPTNYAENKLIQDILDGKTKPEDSTLLKIFERNKTQWKDMLVVCDVTGSMSPYTAQLLLWIKANQKLRNMKDIVFFNDDEERSTNQTIKEDTSGIWSASSGDFKKVIDVALEAMKKGHHIENNLEAVCAAVKKFPDGKGKVIMIADNWEDPCDMELLNYLKSQKIPLRIIICGVNASINTIYLDLARATGGSIHTMESDLTDLANLGEGKKLKIGSAEVVLQNGKFYQTKK